MQVLESKKMSVLELKNELLEIIVSLQTEEALAKILESAREVVEEEDLWAFVPDEQVDRIFKIIENSANRDNLLTHEEAKKRHAKWLS